MDNYSTFRDELIGINENILSLLSTAKSVPGVIDHQLADWEKTCEGLRSQLSDEVIRVAVVGPIKSGKSTFLNSILKNDYLRRGAGVVTSIVTRVRAGERLKAFVYFKSWVEVNADIDQALVLFPSSNRHPKDVKFDIRQAEARAELWSALKSLKSDQLINRDTRSIYNVLLTSYLKGYDTVSEILTEGFAVRQYEEDHFKEHKTFVGNETLAVYLRDVQLEVVSPGLEDNLELADCQGSDSSNPLHLAMIQDYLSQTHLIIYVISSRTGLRRADIRFLSMIKKMGIIDNILFIINCDFSEHESIEDLRALIEQVQEELSMIKPEPSVFTFSALFNLFCSQKNILSRKNRARLKQWEIDMDLVNFSGQETARFESAFNEKLTQQRNSLLLKNHLERLNLISSGIHGWVGINKDILNGDNKSAQVIIKRLNQHQERLSQLRTFLGTTLAGAVAKLKKKLSSDVNRFFDSHSGEINSKISKFINNYRELPDFSDNNIDLSFFNKTIYLSFQDFKHALDSFITEVINPEVIRFIKTKEKETIENIETIIQPFDVMLGDAYAEYNRLMEKFGVTPTFEARPKINLSDMEALLQQAGLRPPTIATAMRYSARMKTSGIVRFGFYSLQSNFKKLIKKPAKERSEVVRMALKGSMQQMKHETRKSIIEHFIDYRENLKFGYFSKFVEVTADFFAESSLERFQIYFTDFSTLAQHINNTQAEKERTNEILVEMDQISNRIKERIYRLREKIELSVKYQFQNPYR